jgi:type II secretory pathway pseudopilin PulG
LSANHAKTTTPIRITMTHPETSGRPHPNRRTTDRYLPFLPYVLAILLVVVLMVGVLATVALSNARRSTSAAREARALATKVEAVRRQSENRSVRRALGQCQRVQTLRGQQVNPTEAIIYLILRAAADSPNANAVTARTFSALYPLLAEGPPTDCQAAVGSPLGYRPLPVKRYTIKIACDVVDGRAHLLHQPLPKFPLCAGSGK